ncbi:MAG: hypothetical protein NVS1B10_01380 [Candidatus Saccharimonadales bacterium]
MTKQQIWDKEHTAYFEFTKEELELLIGALDLSLSDPDYYIMMHEERIAALMQGFTYVHTMMELGNG